MDGSEAAAAPASTEEVPGTSADSRQTGGSMSNCGEGVSSSVRKSLSKSGNMHVSKRKISRKFYSFGRNFGVDSLRRYVDSFLGDAASETELTRQQTIKLRIRELLDENSHKFSSTAVGIVILSVILLSSATFVFETTKSVKRDVRVMDIFNDLEYFYVVFFTLEIGIRFYAHVESFEDFVNFFRNLQNLIDIAAVVPSYLNYMIKGDDLDLRFLRLTRVFRVVKLTKLGPKVQVVFDALSEAQDVLIMLFMNLMIIVVIFSSITYYFEKDQPCDDVGGRGDCFHSIPETCWWAIVTVRFTFATIRCVATTPCAGRPRYGSLVSSHARFCLLRYRLPTLCDTSGRYALETGYQMVTETCVLTIGLMTANSRPFSKPSRNLPTRDA